MPILPKEIDIYPMDLFDPEGAARDFGPWWAFYTLSRREKDLCRRLLQLEIPFFCPIISRRSRSSSGRTRISHVPLFPGYVFVRAGAEQRAAALTTNCVSRTLQVVDGVDLQQDLVHVRRLIEADVALTPESRLAAGTRVRVRSGPLMGVEGVVLKRHNRDRLLVAVRFLQQGASVALDDFQVEAL